MKLKWYVKKTLEYAEQQMLIEYRKHDCGCHVYSEMTSDQIDQTQTSYLLVQFHIFNEKGKNYTWSNTSSVGV